MNAAQQFLQVFVTALFALSAAGSYGGGRVVAWGANNYFVPPRATNITAIAAGGRHALALRSDGSVMGWGNGAAAEVPADLKNVAAISAGGEHSLALDSNGVVFAWGAGFTNAGT